MTSSRSPSFAAARLVTLFLIALSVFTDVRSSVVLVHAQTTCTGACGLTLFTGTPPICASVFISVTGTASGGVVGTSVYPRTQDIQRAAVHAGYVSSGQTRNLYLYWAGSRAAFYASRRFGIVSTWSGVAADGVLLTNSTTCPTGITSTATPLM